MQNSLKVCAVTCFYGRKRKVERIIRCFLDQDYENSYLLLYNNSSVEFKLEEENDKIILVNNSTDLKTWDGYKDTGAVFRDALVFVPEDTDIITFMDSDDLFLPNHISEGVGGIRQAYDMGMLAYKPKFSWFHYIDEISKGQNNNEPSIFVDFDYISNEGFHPLPCSYHQKWLDKLIEDKKIYIKQDGLSTFVYDWGKGHGDFKISGLGDDIDNFKRHREYETDFGDGVLRPVKQIDYNQWNS